MTDADARRYGRIARADLQQARRMLELSGFRDSSIGFLLQQSAEKALKALIHIAGGEAPFTHDLASLLDLLDELGEQPGSGDLLSELLCGAVALRRRHRDQPA